MAFPIGLGLAGIGFAGSLLSGRSEGRSSEIDSLIKQMIQRSRGLTPERRAKILEQSEKRLTQDFMALSEQGRAAIERSGGGSAREVGFIGDLASKRFGALGDISLGIENLDQQFRDQSQEQLIRLLLHQDEVERGRNKGAAFSQLFGAGLNLALTPRAKETRSFD
jgi:hypothetical protein